MSVIHGIGGIGTLHVPDMNIIDIDVVITIATTTLSHDPHRPRRYLGGSVLPHVTLPEIAESSPQYGRAVVSSPPRRTDRLTAKLLLLEVPDTSN